MKRRPGADDSDGDVRLPLGVAPGTNGEYIPDLPTRRDLDVENAALAHADEMARVAGVDRRRFLQTAGGVAAVLATIDLAACSASAKRGALGATSTSRSTTASSRPGGSYTVPPPHDIQACERALGGNGEFVVDVHTHHVMPDGPWAKNAPDTVQLVLGMVPACGSSNRLECASRAAYLRDLFLGSDTTVAMLSDVPNSGPADAPVPFLDQLGTQQLAAQLTHGGAPRVLVHNVIAPNFGDLNARLAEMEATAKTGKVAAFKMYTAWGPNGQGFALDDPAIGLPVIQKAHDLGVKTIIAHKGLPLVRFDAAHNRPDDMVAVSRQFPDMNFVVFHGAWDKNHREGAYDPNASIGIDTFLRALDVHQVPPNDNVWVDVGTVWREVLRDPNTAAHTIGKLLKRVGEHRVLWGTDAIWYGSPQAQLQAFRAFTISNEFQALFGYPALTPAIKAQVLGLNAAKLFKLDAEATRCALATDPISGARLTAAHWRDDDMLPAGSRPNGPTTRREMLQWLASPATRWTPL
ncbi:MAG TPA: amidohydrolase family protein [Acidimicrobiia bacterium]|nr:amidohydrolase family protein [Acidimicrobiia bacterium]